MDLPGINHFYVKIIWLIVPVGEKPCTVAYQMLESLMVVD